MKIVFKNITSMLNVFPIHHLLDIVIPKTMKKSIKSSWKLPMN